MHCTVRFDEPMQQWPSRHLGKEHIATVPVAVSMIAFPGPHRHRGTIRCGAPQGTNNSQLPTRYRLLRLGNPIGICAPLQAPRPLTQHDNSYSSVAADKATLNQLMHRNLNSPASR